MFNSALFRQVIAAISSALGCLVLGGIIGYSSPAVPSMQRGEASGVSDKELTDAMATWIGSLNPLGALVGSFVAGVIIDIVGRKRTLLLISAPGFVLAWFLVGFSVHVAMTFAGRFIGGLITGLTLVTNSMYIVETSEANVRGMTGSFPQLFICTGILFAYGVGVVLNWKILAFVCCSLVVPFFLCMLLVPESPVWLLKQGRKTEAERSLMWLRQKLSQDLKMEIEEIEMALQKEQENKVSIKEFLKPSVYKPFIISLALMFFQQASGVNGVVYFANNIFAAAGMSLNPDVCAVLLGAVQAGVTLISSQLVDRTGRKTLEIVSASLMTVPLICIGLFFFWQENKNDIDLVNHTGWLPLASVLIFMFAFSIGYGPLPWLVTSEVLPQEVRSLAVSIANAFNWTMAFIVTETFLPLCKAIGTYSTFWIFAGCTVASIVFVVFFQPETKGKSLEEIRECFH